MMFKPVEQINFNDDNDNVHQSLIQKSRHRLCELKLDTETYIRFLHVVNFILSCQLYYFIYYHHHICIN